MKSAKLALWIGIAILLSLALTGWMADQEARIWLAFGAISTGVLFLCGKWLWLAGRAWRNGSYSIFGFFTRFLGLVAGLALYVLVWVWFLRPDLLPQRVDYDLIANRHVTERLVDKDLLKVEQWDILGDTRQVLFVHPAPSGSTTLVYPVKIEPRTTFRAALAVAPQAWNAEGDGVVFSVYVEDEAGIHLVFSRYVDPKHHELDRNWLPISIRLTDYNGKLVRIILEVDSGPAGDGRYDWAGWGEPRLESPRWP